jgi:hypothetical protein
VCDFRDILEGVSWPSKPSKSSYWRNLFNQNPKLVKIRSNSALREQWEKDHPGQKFDESWSQSLSNVKSMLRNKHKKGGRPKAAANGQSQGPSAAELRQAALERLEGAVDQCLWTARQMDSTGLDRAIKHLHAARNEIVWKSSRKNA